MAETAILRWNERVKLVSTVLSNLGSAALAAGFVKAFFSQLDIYGPLWILGGLVLIWTGVGSLTMLEAE